MARSTGQDLPGVAKLAEGIGREGACGSVPENFVCGGGYQIGDNGRKLMVAMVTTMTMMETMQTKMVMWPITIRSDEQKD